MNWKQAAILTMAIAESLALSCGGKSTSDQSITTEIQAKLYNDATTKPANITVAVKDGVVTLSGDVSSPDVELEAMKVANGAAGVKRVEDQMKVNAAAMPAAGPAPAPISATPPAVPPPTSTQPAQTATAPPPGTAPPPQTASAPGTEAAAPAAEAAAPAPPPKPRPVAITIPSGTNFSVRMIDSIDSKNNTTGQTFRASLSSPITRNGHTVIPSGSPATVLLTNAKGAGRIKGSSELSVAVTTIAYQGRPYEVSSNVNSAQGKGRGKQTAVRTGIGAAAGALIGGIAGGGKGAAIGSLAGGGAGVGFQALTHGQQVQIPSETVLTFTLSAPLTVEKMVR